MLRYKMQVPEIRLSAYTVQPAIINGPVHYN